MPITSVTGTLAQNNTVSINGSGFGASQGTSNLLFWSIGGDLGLVEPATWSDTVITALIPFNADLPGTATSYFVAQVSVTGVGMRSPGFVVLPLVPTPGVLAPSTVVFCPAGTLGSTGGGG